MIERLRRALEQIEALSPDVQEELAEMIEQHTQRADVSLERLAGAWGDLPDTFDEMLDALAQIRHSHAPTPPIDEQLAWMDEVTPS